MSKFVKKFKNGLKSVAQKDIYLKHKTEEEFEEVWSLFEDICRKKDIEVDPSLIEKCQMKNESSPELGFYTIVPREALSNCTDQQFSKLRREITKESKLRRRAIEFILTLYYAATTIFWGFILSPYVLSLTAFSAKSSRLQTNMILVAHVISFAEAWFANRGWLTFNSQQHGAGVLLAKNTYRLLFLGLCAHTHEFINTSSGLPLLIFIWAISNAVKCGLSFIRYRLSDWMVRNEAVVEGLFRPAPLINGLEKHFFKFSIPVCLISEIWCCQELLLTMNLGYLMSTISINSLYGLLCSVYFIAYTSYSEEAAAAAT